jgi:hypothetical protein
MTVLMEDSWMTGNVRGFHYRGLLRAVVTATDVTISLVVTKLVLVRIPLTEIREVRQVRNILLFGIKISYRTRYGLSTVTLATRHYRDWAGIFTQLGVSVKPPGGWFDFG